MEANSYRQITQEQAKEMLDTREAIVLDVREQEEYDSGHIPGAVLLPVGTITKDAAATVIEDLDTVVLVYCRSGNRSKQAGTGQNSGACPGSSYGKRKTAKTLVQRADRIKKT